MISEIALRDERRGFFFGTPPAIEWDFHNSFCSLSQQALPSHQHRLFFAVDVALISPFYLSSRSHGLTTLMNLELSIVPYKLTTHRREKNNFARKQITVIAECNVITSCRANK
jgi:hypothetical protein